MIIYVMVFLFSASWVCALNFFFSFCPRKTIPRCSCFLLISEEHRISAQCRASSEVRPSLSRLCPVEPWTLQGQTLQSLGVNLCQWCLWLMLKSLPNRQMEHFFVYAACLLSSHSTPLLKMEVWYLDNMGFIRLWLGAFAAFFSSGWTSPFSPASQRACAPYLWTYAWPFAPASFYSGVYYLFIVSETLKLDVVF